MTNIEITNIIKDIRLQKQKLSLAYTKLHRAEIKLKVQREENNYQNKCCLCGKKLKDRESNNALPIVKGNCCDKCNHTKVIPKRIELSMKDGDLRE